MKDLKTDCRLAIVQAAPVMFNKDACLQKALRLIEEAAKNGADVVISADFKHHILALALETGLAVIQLTHYASEKYGFENYYRKIRKQAGIPCVFHTDEALL